MIAVHTFNSLVLRKHQSILVSAITITIGWILAGLLGTKYYSLILTEGLMMVGQLVPHCLIPGPTNLESPMALTVFPAV
jgi:hypothetical protein